MIRTSRPIVILRRSVTRARRVGREARATPAALALAAVAALSLASGSDASREVLSDLDCVVEPSAVVDLGAAVPGLLAETRHDRGDFVAAGTLMAQLESGVEQVALAIAAQLADSATAVELREATRAFGARTLARNERLGGASGVSEQTLDQVRTEAEIAHLQTLQEREGRVLARLELKRAQALLARREIRSPIAGSVIERFHEAGEYVDGEPVFRVARLDPLHVEVIVPIEYLGTLAGGMRAAVTLDAPGFESRPLEAVVRRIDAVADAASATYGVRLVLENPDMTIPSGVRCQVDFFGA